MVGVSSTSMDFWFGDKPVLRNKDHKVTFNFPLAIFKKRQGSTVCKYCMGSSAACSTQTIVAREYNIAKKT